METIKFTAYATYPKERVILFAEKKGYVQNEEQTAEDFVQEFLQKSIVEILLTPTLEDITNQIESDKADQILQATDSINELVKVYYD